MSLTVVTLTSNTRPELLERCCSSVRDALPVGAKHEIVYTKYEDFAETRYKTALSDQYVCYVDDDDTIDPWALDRCLRALKQSGAGLACTNEAEVTLTGKVIRVCHGMKLYQNITKHPRHIHHLAMWDSAYVDPVALKLDAKYTVGIDWFIKTNAALKGGAIHVPMTGYFWTRNPVSMTTSDTRQTHFRIEEMSKDIEKTWGTRVGIIPQFGEENW